MTTSKVRHPLQEPSKVDLETLAASAQMVAAYHRPAPGLPARG